MPDRSTRTHDRCWMQSTIPGPPGPDALRRPDDVTYHLQREAQERVAGARAIDRSVRRVHLDLADLHAQRVRRAGSPGGRFDGEAAAIGKAMATRDDEPVSPPA